MPVLRFMLATMARITNQSGTVSLTLILLLVVYLGGCASTSNGRGFWSSSPRATPSDQFLLPPDGSDVVGQVQVTEARYEDTLLDIARRYNLGYEEIVAANPDVDVWLPGEGTLIVLPTQFVLPDGPREGLVLNLASMRLFYYPDAEPGKPRKVITHPVGIGREGWRTPQGVLRITEKKAQPSWTVPASVRREHAEKGDPLPAIVPPGPDNPLGEFAMRLSNPNYLIHGTNQPYGVGLRVSHGCVRLYPEDISRLFHVVSEGTRVRIVNEPYVAGWRDGQLYLEAHSPLAEDARRWKGSLAPMERAVSAKVVNASGEIDWNKARAVARDARGLPLPVAPGSPGLNEVLEDARRVPSMPRWAVPVEDLGQKVEIEPSAVDPASEAHRPL